MHVKRAEMFWKREVLSASIRESRIDKHEGEREREREEIQRARANFRHEFFHPFFPLLPHSCLLHDGKKWNKEMHSWSFLTYECNFKRIESEGPRERGKERTHLLSTSSGWLQDASEKTARDVSCFLELAPVKSHFSPINVPSAVNYWLLEPPLFFGGGGREPTFVVLMQEMGKHVCRK